MGHGHGRRDGRGAERHPLRLRRPAAAFRREPHRRTGSTPQQFRTRTPQTTLGASLTVLCPFGEYLPSKLINIGTNRWAFKPELGLSHPSGKWTFELYAGVWFFTDNTDFFGGHARTQNPLATYPAHDIYNVNSRACAAFDFTYYSGWQTTLDGERKDDRHGGYVLEIRKVYPSGVADAAYFNPNPIRWRKPRRPRSFFGDRVRRAAGRQLPREHLHAHL